MPKSKVDRPLLYQILRAPSVSSHEDSLRELYYGHFKERSGVIVGKDVVGNVSAAWPGHPSAPKIMLTAHMDEVGFIVTGFDGAFLKFEPVGGIDIALIQGTPVDVHTKAGVVAGVFGKRPIHVMEFDEEDALSDMYIDVGAPTLLAVKKLVELGDVVTWRSDILSLGGNVLAARAADDKVGVYVVMRVLDELLKHPISTPPCGVFGVLTPDEETAGSCARCAANKINPTLAIVVEATDTGDYPDCKTSEFRPTGLSQGPVLSVGLSVNKKLNGFFRTTAASLKVPLQFEVQSGHSGTVMEEIRTAGTGIPCAVISVPVRYMHAPYSVFDVKVLEDAVRLITQVCLTAGSIESFIP